MGLLSKLWFRIANDIVHDLAAGTWPGAAIALWLVRDRADRVLPPDTAALSLRAWSAAFLVMFGALATSIVTGIVRARYRTYGLTTPIIRSRTRAALIKHAVFVMVLILATVLAVMSLQR